MATIKINKFAEPVNAQQEAAEASDEIPEGVLMALGLGLGVGVGLILSMLFQTAFGVAGPVLFVLGMAGGFVLGIIGEHQNRHGLLAWLRRKATEARQRAAAMAAAKREAEGKKPVDETQSKSDKQRALEDAAQSAGKKDEAIGNVEKPTDAEDKKSGGSDALKAVTDAAGEVKPAAERGADVQPEAGAGEKTADAKANDEAAAKAADEAANAPESKPVASGEDKADTDTDTDADAQGEEKAVAKADESVAEDPSGKKEEKPADKTDDVKS